MKKVILGLFAVLMMTSMVFAGTSTSVGFSINEKSEEIIMNDISSAGNSISFGWVLVVLLIVIVAYFMIRSDKKKPKKVAKKVVTKKSPVKKSSSKKVVTKKSPAKKVPSKKKK